MERIEEAKGLNEAVWIAIHSVTHVFQDNAEILIHKGALT
jgi:hypothetical protein